MQKVQVGTGEICRERVQTGLLRPPPPTLQLLPLKQDPRGTSQLDFSAVGLQGSDTCLAGVLPSSDAKHHSTSMKARPGVEFPEPLACEKT